MFRRFLILSLFSIGFLWTGHAKLHANELINSSTFTDTNQKSSLDSLSFLQERISAQFITRYLQDSNIFLRENETEADIINASVQLGIKGGVYRRILAFHIVLFMEEITFLRSLMNLNMIPQPTIIFSLVLN